MECRYIYSQDMGHKDMLIDQGGGGGEEEEEEEEEEVDQPAFE